MENPGALRVVVIDDNVDGAECLASLIEMIGHTVRMAHDGPTGIEVVREFDPDVVFLDIGLPRMNGYEVARHLRSAANSRAVLAAVSGYSHDDDRHRGNAAFEQHFLKPVEFATLRTFLGSLSDRLAGEWERPNSDVAARLERPWSDMSLPGRNRPGRMCGGRYCLIRFRKMSAGFSISTSSRLTSWKSFGSLARILGGSGAQALSPSRFRLPPPEWRRIWRLCAGVGSWLPRQEAPKLSAVTTSRLRHSTRW